MAESVFVKPELIDWAIARSRLPADELAQAFPKLDAWKSGERRPTFKQLERFATKTMTPFGYFFLDAPPEEKLPIPDFRTVGDTPIDRPSPNLIETIQAMQRRQEWMREYVIEEGHDPLEFVGSGANIHNEVSLAARIRKTLGLTADWAEAHKTWEDALRRLRNSAEQIGVLVATSGVVRLNNHRQLDPQEFRGFVFCDAYAPLIFINGADYKSAQMFTVAHELAHLWVGKDSLFNLIRMMPHRDVAERFCNQVAAELLVPRHKLAERWAAVKATDRRFHTLAQSFKVSPIVAARRALDLKLISKGEFFTFYEKDQDEWRTIRAKEKEKAKQKKGGPDFYDVQDIRLSRKFAYAVVRAVREGRLLYREAYQLTDLRGETFSRYANRVLQRMKDERQ
ncbi:MAG: ImmA/IrrE family metallo-endopeptidase [Phycisphaerae bacterium]|jgi:Zn-dependent peptidase ImmA (M78 family)